jgi:hypothetical protein
MFGGRIMQDAAKGRAVSPLRTTAGKLRFAARAFRILAEGAERYAELWEATAARLLGAFRQEVEAERVGLGMAAYERACEAGLPTTAEEVGQRQPDGKIRCRWCGVFFLSMEGHRGAPS